MTLEIGGVDRALEALQAALGRVDFNLSGDRRAERLAARDRLVRDVAGHRARLRDLGAPLLVVLGGVTGAGKSTLVNTLLGRPAVPTGVLRPTTYGPTLVTAPGDADWFTGERVLPGLARVEPRSGQASARQQPGTLVLLRDRSLPEGLALVDAPDVDSIGEGNRDLADRLLDAADLWLWCTTVGKYADEDSMRYLRRAAARRTALAVLLSQVRPEDVSVVVTDFRGKLRAEGLGDVPVLVVPWTTVANEQLPPDAVADLRAWLHELADPMRRAQQRRQTLEGALDALPSELAPLAEALEDEARVGRELNDEVDRAFDAAERDFAAALEQGLPLRQEVLARWERYVGGGRFLRMAEEATGQALAWLRGLADTPVDPRERRVERETRVEVAGTLGGLVTQLADLAAGQAAAAWGATPPGRDLLAQHPELHHRPDDLPARAQALVAGWQDDVVRLVETAGAQRRSNARLASTAVTTVAGVALLVVLGSTGGLTGAEAGIAAGAAAAHQTLLVKLLGAGNLRWLVERARASLQERFATLTDQERERYAAILQRSDPGEEATGLGNAMHEIASARGTELPAGDAQGALPRGLRALTRGAAESLGAAPADRQPAPVEGASYPGGDAGRAGGGA